MRIRKRLAPSSIPTAALSDLQFQRSEAALPSDEPSDPPKQPSGQSMAIRSKTNRCVFPKNDKTEEKMKQKEFGDDETWTVEAKKSTNDDIRKIVNICDGEEGSNKILQPSSSSAQDLLCVCTKTHAYNCKESWCEGDYKVVPLKKRKGSFERNPNEERMSAKMKSKTNKKCGDLLQVDQKPVMEENGIGCSSGGGVKKSKRGNVIMEGSRCSRVNGRGWRCCQPTLVGYSLCEHHLGKGRLRSMASVRRGNVVVVVVHSHRSRVVETRRSSSH
ncbi:hypothetical protein Pfo_028175 [Paulownia fortunei]|nr:hypothetical protein Pfo_028175 [Paulownia fortunei]